MAVMALRCTFANSRSIDSFASCRMISGFSTSFALVESSRFMKVPFGAFMPDRVFVPGSTNPNNSINTVDLPVNVGVIKMAAFAIASLSLIGIPPASGFVSKWYLAVGSIERGSAWPLAVLLASSLLNAAYLGPIVYKAYFEDAPAGEHKVREVPWMVLPLMLTAAVSLLLGIYPDPVLILASTLMR